MNEILPKKNRISTCFIQNSRVFSCAHAEQWEDERKNKDLLEKFWLYLQNQTLNRLIHFRTELKI